MPSAQPTSNDWSCKTIPAANRLESVAHDVKRDLERNVVCLFGIPFDDICLTDAIARIDTSSRNRKRCIITTPNTNFVVHANKNIEFRNSILNSDLTLIDGMPLVWVARFLSLPIKERITGTSLLNALYKRKNNSVINTFFLGGRPGVAERASNTVNEKNLGIRASGFHDPGFTTIDTMSSDVVIDRINSSGADFLVLALGAVKAGLWIERNKSRLIVPVISHLGCALNYVSGTFKRAPLFLQNSGLEWLWRIYQEPYLWKRYLLDGIALLGLISRRILPYYFWQKHIKHKRTSCESFSHCLIVNQDFVDLILRGDVCTESIDELTDALYQCYLHKKRVRLNLNSVQFLDSCAIGKFLILNKHLISNNLALRITKPTKTIEKIIYWHCAESLIDTRA